MQQDQEEAFARFVRAHSASLFRTAYLMTGDYHRAEDLLQTSLVKVYQRWPRVAQMGAPVAYTRTVLVNQTTSWWRRRSSRETPQPLPDQATWSGGVDHVEEHHRVWAAVLTLPPRQRAVIVLRYYEDLSEAQIADTLGISPGTVKSHSHAATQRLAELLGEPTTSAPLHIKEATS